ncbi:RNA-binding domain-containing protein [Paenibacillus dauci]|uniref:RNA-binding domain-containing protein n=1 Tax=Paenibacillus dauci TaxID=1567106 RepID=UPI000619B7D9|nr:RNA-binding domain-containing protein [Paenibacillus dauci]
MQYQHIMTEFQQLLALPAETECVEFKEAKYNFDFNKLGKYFSALSNEANLKNKDYAWLIFGIEDKNRAVVGSQYRANRPELDSLKKEVSDHTGGITFQEIYELYYEGKRIILFKIPPASLGIPTSWQGHYYGRNGESISPLSIQKYEEIRNQNNRKDWSAKIIPQATIKDLDTSAIKKARNEYANKFPKLAEEMQEWDDITFLNKAKVTINNRITNTSIILLGKAESEHLINPSVAKISWILKDENNIAKDYEHFGPPFILNTELAYSKIRNLKYRYLPDDSLFPIEVNQYDSYVIREALHNCIAHQDYTLSGRINLIELPEQILFTNLGSFIPKSIETVIKQDAPQEFYRNRFLAEAMVNLNMIDTIGSGIKKMFVTQKKRFFPLPDYNLNETDKVEVRIIGKVLDENYTRILINQTNLDLDTVMLLDKVQKKVKITTEEAKQLRNKNLIEGRQPHLYVSAQIARLTGDKSTYVKNRAFDKEHYKNLIIAFLEKYESASRQDIDSLLLDKFSDMLNGEQRKKKINNLLFEMSSKDKSIFNQGSSRKSKWVLTKNINNYLF